jgi:hypothetical protein
MIIKNLKKIREYWCQRMNSSHKKLSRGAEYIQKIITSAHGDGWRRNNRHDTKK